MNELLVGSQVILSLQLPFAIWPLVNITSDISSMSVEFYRDGTVSEKSLSQILEGRRQTAECPHTGNVRVSFANGVMLKSIVWVVSVLITLFNAVLVLQFTGIWGLIFS
jgi:Mn2+/Fe2+ NRAMP family transporter